jgi:hypothetical protein
VSGTPSAPALRPLGVGERIDASIKLYLKGFAAFAPAILVVAVPIALVLGALAWWRTDTFVVHGALVTRNLDGTTTTHWGVFGQSLGGLGLTELAGLVLYAPAKAIAYVRFGDAYLGRSGTWSSVLAGGLRRAGPLLWIDALVKGIPVGAIGLVVLVGIALSPLGPAAFVLLVAPALLAVGFVVWWGVACCAVGPALAMEGRHGLGAIRRSAGLVRGGWGSCLGTLLLAQLLVIVVTLVANGLLGVLVSALVPASARPGPHAFVLALLEALVDVAALLLFACAVNTVLAVDLRVRHEGLDLAVLTDSLDGAAPDFLPRRPATLAPGRAGAGAPPPALPDPWPPPPR